MKNAIINWIGKHKKIHYIYLCFRHLNDKNFVHDILYPDEDIYKLIIASNGEEHKGRILYRIKRDNSDFFTNFLNVLSDIWFSDTIGMCPVVVCGEESPYFEKRGINGEINVWEYYFQQYEDYHLEDLNVAFRMTDTVKNIKGSFNIGREECCRPTQEYFLELGRIMKKYIRLQPSVEMYIQYNIKRILNGKKTLGVQIQVGGALKNYNGHAIDYFLDAYIVAIREVVNKTYEQIFVMADDDCVFEKMEEEFGDSVVYYCKVDKLFSEFLLHNTEAKNGLQNYKRGLQEILNMYTLSKCDGLVTGVSHASFAIQVAKLALNENYKDVRIIDKRIVDNKKIFL